MRQAEFLFAFIALTTTGIWAQDAVSLSQKIHQVPDEDGVYYTGPEVSAPKLVRVAFAPYPSDVPGKNHIQLIVADQPCLADGQVNHCDEAILLLAHPDRHKLREAVNGCPTGAISIAEDD